MADGVVRWHAVHDFPGAELPLHHLGGDEHGGVGVALAVELRVEGTKSGLLHFTRHHRAVLEHGNAVDLLLERLVRDRLLQLGERVHGNDRGELAAGDDVFARRIDVHAVWRLGRRKEVDHADAVVRIEHLHARLRLRLRGATLLVHVVVHVLRGRIGRLAFRDARFGALVIHGRDEVLVVLRGVRLELGVRLLTVVRREEEPSVGRPLAGVTEVVVVARHQDLEGDVHLAGLVRGDERQGALEALLVVGDGHVGVGNRHAEPCGRHDVLAVRGGERRCVAARRIGDLENLVRLEAREIDAGNPRRVVAVDEEPASVGDAVGHRQLGVMRIVPGHEAEGGVQHRLRLFIVSPAVLGILREHGNDLQQAAGGQAVHGHLAAEAAGHEGVQFVLRAWRDVHARCGIAADEVVRAASRGAIAGEGEQTCGDDGRADPEGACCW